MMIPDFEKLYEPYSEKASLELTLEWMSKQAKSLGIDESVMQAAILETFLEMARGKTFSIDGGDTGFDGLPHAVMNHYMLQKMRDKNLEVQKIKRNILEENLKQFVLKHIDELNQKYLNENVHIVEKVEETPSKLLNETLVELPIETSEVGFFNLKASPVLRWFGYGS